MSVTTPLAPQPKNLAETSILLMKESERERARLIIFLRINDEKKGCYFCGNESIYPNNSALFSHAHGHQGKYIWVSNVADGQSRIWEESSKNRL